MHFPTPTTPYYTKKGYIECLFLLWSFHATEQHKKSLKDTLKKITTIVQVKKNINLTKLLNVGSAKKN
jgi:hypothetical protein